MEDKFELVDDFQSPKRSKTVIDIPLEEEGDVDDDNWRPKYYDSSEHPLRLMVYCWSSDNIVYYNYYCNL